MIKEESICKQSSVQIVIKLLIFIITQFLIRFNIPVDVILSLFDI